jgi:hypothetical protein
MSEFNPKNGERFLYWDEVSGEWSICKWADTEQIFLSDDGKKVDVHLLQPFPEPPRQLNLLVRLFRAAEQTLAQCQLLDGSYPPEMSELHRVVGQIKSGAS